WARADREGGPRAQLRTATPSARTGGDVVGRRATTLGTATRQLGVVRHGEGKEMSNETTLRIERVIDAPIEAVFEAWTSADAMLIWYRDRPDDVVRVVELDARVGGRY